MGRESAGSVFVTVDGDYGPLIAKYAQAEALSRTAGQRMAGALGQGLNSGGAEVKKYFGLFDEGGRIISSTVPKLDDGAEAIRRVGRAAKESQDKAQSFVGVIPGLGRAAEHFINLLPGVGSAIMAAFPLLGAAALLQNLFQIGNAITRVTGNFGELTDEEKKNADATKQISTEWENLAKQFESGMIERAALEIGKMASLKLGGFFDESEAQRMRSRLAALTEQVKTARAAQQVDVGTASLSSNPLVAGAQTLNPAVTVNRLLANVDWKQQQQKIKPLEDEIGVLTEKLLIYDRVTSKINADKQGKESADLAKQAQTEANRIAREAAAEQKREAAEVQRIKNDEFRQAREFMGLVREGRKITAAENKARVREETRDTMQGLQESAQEFEDAEELKRREIVATTTAHNRAAQEGIRAAGVRTQTADEIASLKIQQEYGQQIVHTKAQELQYEKDLGNQSEKRLVDALATAQALKDYADTNLLIADQNSADLAVVRARGELDKERLENAIRLARAQQQQSIAVQLQTAITRDANGIAESLGNAVASGLTHHSIGQQIMESLKSTGQHILADFFTAGLKAALEASGVNTAAQKLSGVIFGTPATATSAATGGILGKLAQVLHLPGAGNAASQAAAQQRAAQIAQHAAAEQARIASQQAQAVGIAQQQQNTLNTMETTLQQILAAIKAQHTMAGGIIGGIAGGLLGGLIGLAGGGGGGGGEGYAKGGFIAEDQIAPIHKGEWILTADQVAGRTAMPALPNRGGGVSSHTLTASSVSNSSSNAMSIGAIHLHGVQNVEQFARKLPNVLKARAPVFSPATR